MQTDMLRPYASELKRAIRNLEFAADHVEGELRGAEEFARAQMEEAVERLKRVTTQLERTLAG